MKKALNYFCPLFFLSLLTISAQTSTGAYHSIPGREGELKKTVNIWGYVVQPGRYELPMSTNVLQFISIAGGPREHALMNEVKIYRVRDDGSRYLIDLDLDHPEKSRTEDLDLKPEDTIYIDFSSFVSWNNLLAILVGPLSIAASIALILDRSGR